MITVDLTEMRELSKTLQKVHRSALPSAIRNTLNDLSIDVKKTTLGVSVKENFENLRQPKLFKAYSGFIKAKGWEVEKMQSTVGMQPKGDATKVIGNMQKQEVGGYIKNNFAPHKLNRVGGLHKGKVLKDKYIGNIKKIATVPFGNKQELIRAVTATKIQRDGSGKGVGILYGKILYEIKGFKRIDRKNIELHLDSLYSYRKIPRKITPTHFVKDASLDSLKKVNQMFDKNAEFQINKIRKK